MSKIRESCQEVVRLSSHVSINRSILSAFLSSSYTEPSPWSSFPCHYTGPSLIPYIFALDSLNFCFWPHSHFDYQDLALSLKQILESDPSGLSPSTLITFTLQDMTRIFPADFPDLSTRLSKLHELGSVVQQYFAGDYLLLLQSCNNSARTVVFM